MKGTLDLILIENHVRDRVRDGEPATRLGANEGALHNNGLQQSTVELLQELVLLEELRGHGLRKPIFTKLGSGSAESSPVKLVHNVLKKGWVHLGLADLLRCNLNLKRVACLDALDVALKKVVREELHDSWVFLKLLFSTKRYFGENLGWLAGAQSTLSAQIKRGAQRILP